MPTLLCPEPGTPGSPSPRARALLEGRHCPILRVQLEEKTFYSKESPGRVEGRMQVSANSSWARWYPEEGIEDRAKLDQSLPLGASLRPSPVPSLHRAQDEQGSGSLASGLQATEPTPHRGSWHLPEAGTLQVGGAGAFLGVRQAEP